MSKVVVLKESQMKLLIFETENSCKFMHRVFHTPAGLRQTNNANIACEQFKLWQKTFLIGCWDDGAPWPVSSICTCPNCLTYLLTYSCRLVSVLLFTQPFKL